MYAQMLIQNGALSKVSATVDAPVRLLVGVYPQMLRQVTLLPKSAKVYLFIYLRNSLRPKVSTMTAH